MNKKRGTSNSDRRNNELVVVNETCSKIKKLLDKSRKSKKDNQELENLIDEFIALNEKIEDPIALNLLMCSAHIDTYRIMQRASLLTQWIEDIKKLNEEKVALRKKTLDLTNEMIEMYKKHLNNQSDFAHLIEIFSVSYNVQLREYNNLISNMKESKLPYLPYYEEYKSIKIDRKFSNAEREFALNFLDNISTWKSAYFMLCYRKRNDINFLEIFPKLSWIDFRKREELISKNTNVSDTLNEYYEKFYESYRKWHKPKNKKGKPSP